MFYGIDEYYIFLVLPTFAFAMIAQFKVKSTFKKYSKVGSMRRITGADAARQLLRNNGILDVEVTPVSGTLTDHYDPKSKIVRLSSGVYDSTSVAAIGVAAHETGHAIQHNLGYAPLMLRSTLVPVAGIGSSIGPTIAIVGLIFGSALLLKIGIVLFTVAVAFYLITLPVEFNASFRAINLLPATGILTEEENVGVKKVLTAAALTYVASASVAIASLLRLILLGRRLNN